MIGPRTFALPLGLVLLLSLLPAPPARAEWPVKTHTPRRYDWRFAGDLQAFGERMHRSLVRLERSAKRSNRLEVERTIDGVGVVVSPDRVVTPAAWLAGATEIWVVRDHRRLGRARVLARSTVASTRPGETDDGLLLLQLPPGVSRTPVLGFVSLPGPGQVEVALPTVVGQSSALAVSINRGVAIREASGLFVGGILRNGVPAFDRSARVVALCLGPTPDQSRSLAIDGAKVAIFLAGLKTPPAPDKGQAHPEVPMPGEGGTKNPGPAPRGAGPGGP